MFKHFSSFYAKDIYLVECRFLAVWKTRLKWGAPPDRVGLENDEMLLLFSPTRKLFLHKSTRVV